MSNIDAEMEQRRIKALSSYCAYLASKKTPELKTSADRARGFLKRTMLVKKIRESDV